MKLLISMNFVQLGLQITFRKQFDLKLNPTTRLLCLDFLFYNVFNMEQLGGGGVFKTVAVHEILLKMLLKVIQDLYILKFKIKVEMK